MSFRNSLYKFFHWEFWPVYMFYIPIAYYALYHALKQRSWTFIALANPGIKNGGIGTESKYLTQQLIPAKHVPKTLFFSGGQSIEQLINQLKENHLTFPLVVKPDRGFRGLLVKKVNDENALRDYLKNKKIDFLIQQFIELPKECGIFFIRHPEKDKGNITSVTLKESPRIVGDGIRNIEQLVEDDKHLRLFFSQIKELSELDFTQVPDKGQTLVLSAIGNHAKGTKFINGNHLINDGLTQLFSRLNKSIEGWYYGRLDIKYSSWEALEKGDFVIIELNGILGEPTHIYDTSATSYWKALNTIKRHWKQLNSIACYHRQKGLTVPKSSDFVSDLQSLRRYTKYVKTLSK